MLNRLFLKYKNFKNADLLLAGFFGVGIFAFLYFTGTLFSGYHFIDDHQMLSIKNSLTSAPYLRVIIDYLRADFLIRFRPLFFPYYISIIKLFGVNFLSLYLFVGTLAAVSFALFYLGMRELKFPRIASVAFSILIFAGPQMAIWWRLGVNETIGMLFLSITFFLMGKCISGENYKINNGLFVLFLILTSLCKESLIIIIPAFIAFKIWNEKNYFKITFKESLKRNTISLLAIFFMVIELGIIKFVIGTNKIGYAGITSSIAELIKGLRGILFSSSSLGNWVILSTLLALTYAVSFVFVTGKRAQKLKHSILELAPVLIFGFGIILPQILMHAKSGMSERYLVPTTVGFSFLLVALVLKIEKKLFRVAGASLLAIFILLSYNSSITRARIFATEGADAKKLFSAVMGNANPSSKILLVVDPVTRFEVSFSIKNYLSFYGYNGLYAYGINHPATSDFEKGLNNQWAEWFKGRELKNLGQAPDEIIIFDKNQSDDFFAESGLRSSDYKNILADSHEVYIKN